VEKATEWLVAGAGADRSGTLPQGTGKTEREIRYYITSLKPEAHG